MARRIIVCDGLASARLWSRIGAGEDEVLTWVPQEGESRSRPPGFRSLSGGLCAEAIAKLDPKSAEGFAFVSEDPAFARAAVTLVGEVTPNSPVLVLSDVASAEDLPSHPCLRVAAA